MYYGAQALSSLFFAFFLAVVFSLAPLDLHLLRSRRQLQTGDGPDAGMALKN
jgi:hypothetical protein